jgi:hypothetical protein
MATVTMHNIGTLREGSLHAALKAWYAQPGDQFEVKVDGSIIDIVRGDLLIEIQTRGFSSIKRKLIRLIDKHAVHLIYPIASEKWLVRSDSDGTQISRRKSPRRGRIEHLFMEMVNIAHLIEHANFTLEVVFIREEEVWSQAANGHRRSWRNKGWTRHDRRLIEVIESKQLHNPMDFLTVLPADLPAQFTNQELAKVSRQPRYLAQRITYSLRHMGALSMVGKRGRESLYQRVER